MSSDPRSMRKKPADSQQLKNFKDSLTRDIERICDAWPLAVEARRFYGWPSNASHVRVVRFGPDGKVIPPEPDLRPPHSDPTGVLASSLSGDKASLWLESAQKWIWLMIRLTAIEIPSERRWTGGDTTPPALRRTAISAAHQLADDWPLNIWKVFDRIRQLADVATAEWPPTPRKGQVVDGVKVLERDGGVDLCPECKKPVMGTQEDPAVRIDGRPYHRNPCYYTVYRRSQRAKGSSRAVAS